VGATAGGLLLALVFLATLAALIEGQKGELARQNLFLAGVNAVSEPRRSWPSDHRGHDTVYALKFLETQKELRPEKRKFLSVSRSTVGRSDLVACDVCYGVAASRIFGLENECNRWSAGVANEMTRDRPRTRACL
jgi:hypothetical protein